MTGATNRRLFFLIPCIAWLLMSFLVAGSAFLSSDDTMKSMLTDEIKEFVYRFDPVIFLSFAFTFFVFLFWVVPNDLGLKRLNPSNNDTNAKTFLFAILGIAAGSGAIGLSNSFTAAP